MVDALLFHNRPDYSSPQKYVPLELLTVKFQ